MKDFLVLRFLDLFAFFFKWLKIDYKQMRSILQMKLTLDSRRAPAVMASYNQKNSEGKNFFLMSLIFYAVIGLFLISLLLIGDNLLFQMSTIFGVVFFMVSLSLISDFSNVLLDLRDKSIIATKPVDSRTITMAKTVHILIYMSYITLALTVPTLIVGLIKYGFVFFLLYLLSLILINLIIIVMTSFVYLVILRFFSGDKLKDIINYIQIGLTLVVIISYQFLGQLFELSELNYVFEPAWWQYLLIPVWFAAPFELIIHSDYSFHFIMLSLLAFIIPIIAMIAYQKLTPVFEQYLEKLNTSSNHKVKPIGRIKTFLLNRLCRDHEERIMYDYSVRMLKTERKFKLKVYPSLGMALVFPYIFIINFVFRIGRVEELSHNTVYFLYFCALSIPNIIMMLGHSEQYKAAWVFETLPIKNHRLLAKGALKAATNKLVLPIILFNGIVFTILLGPTILLDLSIIVVTLVLYIVITYLLVGFKIPFSQNFDLQDANTAFTFLLMFIVGGLAGVHFIFTKVYYGRWIYLVILIVVTILTWSITFKKKNAPLPT